MPNRFTPIQTGTDPNQQLAIINKNFAELDAEGTTKVYYNAAGNVGVTEGLLPNNVGEGIILNDSNGTPLIAMYVDSNNNPILKVAKSGQNATTATNDQLAFNSSQNVFQIVGTPLTVGFSLTSTTGAVGRATVTINHNLGYVPLTESTVNITADWNGLAGIFPIPYFVPATNSALASSSIFALASFVRVSNVTTTQIKYDIGVIAGGSTIAGTITCYVKQQSAV